MTILCRQRCFSLRFRMRCRLLDCYAWLRSIPFDTFNLAAWRYHPWSFNILCVKSRSYWRFWMHSMYSTAAFVNITLHCITLSLHYVTFTTITVNVILYIWVRGHANAWSQMKPSSWMDAAGFEPTEGRAGGKRSKWFMSNNGAPKPVRHENHPAGWVIERGGVALCDACGFCVVLRFAMGFSFFVKFASRFHWFYCFFCAHAVKVWHFIPCSILGGHSQSDSVAMVLAHESGYFSAELVTSVWSHLCQDLASQIHEEIYVFRGFPAPWPRPDICAHGLVGR